MSGPSSVATSVAVAHSRLGREVVSLPLCFASSCRALASATPARGKAGTES